MGFKASLSDDKSELTMTIDGRFDFNIHSDFRNAYRDLPPTTKFVIDLSKASFMDSSAMGMLLLLNCNPAVRKILSISNLDKMFDMG
jgi:anti-anti-sigma regulatory factor